MSTKSYKRLYELLSTNVIEHNIDLELLSNKINTNKDVKISELILGVMRENPYHSDRILEQGEKGIEFDLNALSSMQISILYRLLTMLDERCNK